MYRKFIVILFVIGVVFQGQDVLAEKIGITVDQSIFAFYLKFSTEK